jgi:hypothetical protein
VEVLGEILRFEQTVFPSVMDDFFQRSLLLFPKAPSSVVGIFDGSINKEHGMVFEKRVLM